jgi:hypothetical protein
MRIATRNPDGPEDLMKEICVGCGAVARLAGFRYTIQGEVGGINEENQTVYLRSPGFADWVPASEVIDVIPPEHQTYQGIYDNNVNLSSKFVPEPKK